MDAEGLACNIIAPTFTPTSKTAGAICLIYLAELLAGSLPPKQQPGSPKIGPSSIKTSCGANW